MQAAAGSRWEAAWALHLEPLGTKLCIDPRCYFENWGSIHLQSLQEVRINPALPSEMVLLWRVFWGCSSSKWRFWLQPHVPEQRGILQCHLSATKAPNTSGWLIRHYWCMDPAALKMRSGLRFIGLGRMCCFVTPVKHRQQDVGRPPTSVRATQGSLEEKLLLLYVK